MTRRRRRPRARRRPAVPARRRSPTADELLVDGDEGRHAVDVLRLAPGEQVRVGDGQRHRRRRARSSPPGPRACGCAVSAAVRGAGAGRRSSCSCRRCRRATAGRSRSTWPPSSASTGSCPWTAARCVTRWRDDRVEKGVAKWRAAARAASKQSRRPRLPEVTEPMTTREVCGLLADADLARRAARAGPPSARRAGHPARRAPSSSSSAPRAGSPTARSWPSAPPARRPCGWAPRCCARPPPAPPRWPPSRMRTRWAMTLAALRTAPRPVPFPAATSGRVHRVGDPPGPGAASAGLLGSAP